MVLRYCLSFIAFLSTSAIAQDDFPIVPDDIEVTLVAKDPVVRNPCAITFGAHGRLYVGMGPQYRKPKPDTPGDSVWILWDRDRDGIAESKSEFATGFNSIQGLVWKGNDLWVANAPELTVVRDLDNDLVADEYVRIYTDLGNLEHGLHGLNVGPDGKIYMSKGNSKGLTQPPNRVAPKPFRDLWGVEAPVAPDFPEPVVYKKGEYKKNYHDPADDWGLTGGVLRCDDGGKNLEIVSRGFRNPWDISYDSEFTWLGTDNDQTHGDKIFSPFYGADFGWGHAWSYDWKGDDHLPTVPSSGPLFEGSGTGVIHVRGMEYPEKYRGIWLVNDWLRRETYIFRPEWNGAHLVPKGGNYRKELFAHAGGGRAMGQSSGRAYDPTDIEVGPDGAIYVASWGRVYGARYEDGELANEGRIYRFMPKKVGPVLGDPQFSKNLAKPFSEWTFEELENGFLSVLQSRKSVVQEEFLRRGKAARVYLESRVREDHGGLWTMWTLGRMAPEDKSLDAVFLHRAQQATNPFFRIQSIRILAHRVRQRGEKVLPEGTESLLRDPLPRVRHAAILAAHEADDRGWNGALIELCAEEKDRIVFYSAWKALLQMMPRVKRKGTLEADKRPGVRRALLLSLLEQDGLSDDEIRAFAEDSDAVIAGLAQRRLGGKHKTEIRGRPLASGAGESRPDRKPARPPIVNPFASIKASTGSPYRVATFEPGVPVYTDRPYRIRGVPSELKGAAFLQTANSDADAESGITVDIEFKYPSTLLLLDDARAEALPRWARNEWHSTKLGITTDDPKAMHAFLHEAPVTKITLGTNRDGVRARKGNYILVARPHLLGPVSEPATLEASLAAMDKADVARGSDLYFSIHGANCAACHRVKNYGNNYAPDLNDIGSRADARTIIESILEPSAAITEGFAAQMIKTNDGATYTGIVLNETGRSVTVAMTGGVTAEVKRSEITERKGLEVSAMPATFRAMLTPAQVADITAFLLTLKKKPESVAGDGEFRFEKIGNDQLALHLGGTKIATYLINDPVLTRRAFVNIRTPSGIKVTRPFPAPKGEDHATMHPGIWMAFGWLSGNDYWRLQSKVAFEKFLAEPEAKGTKAALATRNRCLGKDGKETICIEDTKYEFERVPEGILLSVDATFYNDERDFEFGDQEESGLAVRMAKSLTVQHGNGRILNNHGDRDGKGTWGKEFEWIDYSGIVDGKRVGLLVIPHPENPRPSWSHSRDYGALVANPFPKQPRERREPYVKTKVKQGDRFRLSYKVLVHESDTELDFEAIAKRIR